MMRDPRTAWRLAISLTVLFHAILFRATTSTAAVDLMVESVEAATGGEVEVPITLRGAAGLEGVQFVLVFDPQALELVDVAAGPLAGAADIHLKKREPGTVRVAMLPESALERGEGTLLSARFRVLAEAGREVPIGIQEVKASEFREQFPVWMQVTTTPGGVRTTAKVTVPTWLVVTIAGAAILLLLAILFRVARRTSSARVQAERSATR